jgi:undecaprenyl-diphosphatase
MNFLESTILGFVQGLTEFIPISSSGHLVIAREVFNIEDIGLAFDAFLHLGTLLAVVIYFRKDWIKIIKDAGRDNRMIWNIIIAIIPAGIAGILLEDTISSIFRDPLWVATFMILTACVFLLAEKFYVLRINKKKYEKIGWKDSLIIGIAQVFALLPGVSRSGITISAGMFRSLKRVDATKFSFIMSAVIIFAASGKSAVSLFADNGFSNDTLILVWGGLVAFVSGYLSIKFLMKFLKNHRLYIFSAYLFIVGIILFILQWY